jgi:hypothetical protein
VDTTIITEQEVCVACGFCCDRTLFDSAVMTTRDLELFSHSNFQIIEIEGHKNFSFPCSNFCTKCTIYDQQKPEICDKFFCELIKKMQRNEINSEEAKTTIREIRQKRDDLINLFNQVTGLHAKSFREALFHLEGDTIDLSDTKLKTLYLQFQLLNTHLTKQFKSKEIWNTYYENINQLY